MIITLDLKRSTIKFTKIGEYYLKNIGFTQKVQNLIIMELKICKR